MAIYKIDLFGWDETLGASYSFGMDNDRILKGFLQLKNGCIIFLIMAVFSLTAASASIWTAFDPYNDFASILIFIIEIFVFILLIIGVLYYYFGLTTLIKNINDKQEKLYKSTRIILLVFVGVYLLSSIFSSYFHLIESQPAFTLGKNLFVMIFLSTFLFLFSFIFSSLQKKGYGTRLLYTPIILLTIPSIVGSVLGVIISVIGPYESDEPTNVIGAFIYLYLIICIGISFVEKYSVIRRMTKNIDVQYVIRTPEEKLQVKNIVKKSRKKTVPAKK